MPRSNILFHALPITDLYIPFCLRTKAFNETLAGSLVPSQLEFTYKMTVNQIFFQSKNTCKNISLLQRPPQARKDCVSERACVFCLLYSFPWWEKKEITGLSKANRRGFARFRIKLIGKHCSATRNTRRLYHSEKGTITHRIKNKNLKRRKRTPTGLEDQEGAKS